MTKERPPLEDMTLRQLRRVASEYNISRYSRMRKEQLLEEIREIERTQTTASVVPPRVVEAQTKVEATKFELGQEDVAGGDLASVDEGLMDLPGGYGESRIVLMPRDPQWAYTYWDVPNEHREELRRQGGQQFALRVYDVTDINLEYQAPHSIQEYPCDELARDWYMPIPVSDRDYVVDVGYRCADGRWLVLARSVPVRIPPVYPSDWIEDHFITVSWDDDLRGKTLFKLVTPSQRYALGMTGNAIYDQIFGMAQDAEAQRMAGSLFGSMQHVAGSVFGSVHLTETAASSYVLASGMGMWAVPTMSGITASGVGMGMGMTMSGVGMTMSGVGMIMSGVGMAVPGMGIGEMTMSGIGMSGIGFSASAAPIRPRKFWLVADAELIVYGATEPDATVTIGGRPIKLNSDGTFRFQMSFPDGLIDYPIMAVAADGEQTRSIHMKFERETPERKTNTKEEAVLEWLN